MVITFDIYIKYLYWWLLSSPYIPFMWYKKCGVDRDTPGSWQWCASCLCFWLCCCRCPFWGHTQLLQEVIWCCCVPPRPIRPLDCNMQSWVFLQAADDVYFLAMSIGSWGCRGLPVIVIRDGTCLDWQVFLWPPSCWRCVVLFCFLSMAIGIYIAIRDETLIVTHNGLSDLQDLTWFSAMIDGAAMTVQTHFHKWWD